MSSRPAKLPTRATAARSVRRAIARTEVSAALLPSGPSCLLRAAGGDAIIIDINEAFARRFDLNTSRVRGHPVRETMQADAALAVMRGMRRALASRRAVKCTIPATIAAGTRLFRVTMKRTGADTVLASISENVAFGRRQSDSYMLETLGAVEGGIIYVTNLSTDTVEYVTDHIEKLLGYTREQIEGFVVDPSAAHSEFFQGLYYPDDAPAVIAHLADLRMASDDTVLTLLCRMRHATQGWRWIESRSRILSRNRQGAVERVVGVAVDVTEQRQLSIDLKATSFALLKAEENERRRIAGEIHDSTAQHFVALDLGLSRLENMLGPSIGDYRGWIDEMRGLIKQAHQELRVATFALHPPELSRSTLADTLRELIRGFGRRTGIAAEFQLDGVPRPSAPAVEHALLRVSQEALLNIHKHSHARVAKLRLRYEETIVVLEIEDDGIGADLPETGVGLQSMEARLAALGGVLSIVSGRGGFMVRASIHQAG